MAFDNFSKKFRKKAHKCLELCGLQVDSPSESAQNLWLNIADIAISIFYYGANIVCLWLAQVEVFVLFLNMLCLMQAFIRTIVKRKDCGKRLIGIQRDNNSTALYCPPYTGLAGLEVLIFGVDIFGVWVLLELISLDPSLISPFKIIISVTIFMTFFDGLISNIENMYPAHPRIITRVNT